MREYCRSIAETKWNLTELVELSIAGPGHCLMFICLKDGYLPELTLEIKSKEQTGTMKSVKNVINAWQGVSILDGGGIQLSEIDTT